jgi:hypothetical protein
MTTNHANCDHESTKAARATCRKDRASRTSLKAELLTIFATKTFPYEDDAKWVRYAAGRFCNYTGDDLDIAAGAILSYFLPSGDADQDANRRRNGYTVTDNIHTMLSITLRAAS